MGKSAINQIITMNHGHGCEYLNNDVMIEILFCLPLKSLTRFKTLNKTWHDNISSRDFARRYHDKKKVKPWGLLISGLDWGKSWLSIYSSERCCGFLSPVEVEFRELMGRYFKHFAPRIVGPLDGLICIYDEWHLKTIALFNPYLSNKVEIIPPPPLSPSSSARPNLGFGYDSVTSDYKIVMVFSCYNHSHVIQVYSRATNSWKELDCNVLSRDISIIKPITPYQDGSFAHWHAWELHSSTTGLNDWVVLSFDMRNEVFKVTPLPPCFPGVQRVKAKTSREVKEYSLGIGIHSKEDSLALDYLHMEDERWFIDRWELGGGGWDPLRGVEIDFGGRRLMENNNGLLILHYDHTSRRHVELHYLSPPHGTLTIPKYYYNGEIKHVYLYEPSLIELKANLYPVNPISRAISAAVDSLSGDVGIAVCEVCLEIATVVAVFWIYPRLLARMIS